MDHCAPSEFWELWNSDGLNSVCVNNKQAWFCACLYKLVHSSFGTSKTPAYPFEAKTVSFMFWLSFRWQFCKSNRFCALSSFLPYPPPCSNFNTSLSSVIGKLVESSYGNYPMIQRKEEWALPVDRCLWRTNWWRWTGDMVYLHLGLYFSSSFPFFCSGLSQFSS